MKVKIITATFGRHRITQRCFQGIERIRDTFNLLDIDTEVWCATDDDRHDDLCEQYNINGVRIAPSPIGRRMNDLMQYGSDDYDYLMQIGSDDILDDELIWILSAWMRSGAGMFGVSRMNIVNCYTGEIKEVSQKLVFGAGRCIRRDLIEQTGKLWEDHLLAGLDGNSQTRIFRATGVGCKTVTTPRVMLWDIKSNENLHRWDKFEHCKTVTPEFIPDEIKTITG